MILSVYHHELRPQVSPVGRFCLGGVLTEITANTATGLVALRDDLSAAAAKYGFILRTASLVTPIFVDGERVMHDVVVRSHPNINDLQSD